ncbi:MAG: PfkB family carbohydrate kinase, partial [Minisyncoccia bacterium]
MQAINRFLEQVRSKPLRVLVIGDCLLDEYFQVKVSRISPESPNIAVMRSDDSQPVAVRPGGAANVCCQFKPLGVQADFMGLVDDEAAAHLATAGIRCGHSEPLPSGVPRKRRFFDGDVQVGNRWDIEVPRYGLDEDILKCYQTKLENTMVKVRDDYDAFILSDYDKGLFAGSTFNDHLMFHLKGRLTVVDPKKGPLRKWYGCKVIKPNAAEAAALTGKTDWYEQAAHILNEACCETVVITHGSAGVKVMQEGARFHEYTPRART